MSEIIIRKATAEDVKEITILEQATSNTAWSEKDIAHDINENDKAYVIVARTAEGELASYLDAWIVAGEIQLNNIAVDEKFRRQHIGEQMMQRMIEDNSACEIVNLEVRAGNVAGLGLYSKLGFVKSGERANYYEDNGETAVLMDKLIK